jgi:hypothetical protein
MGGRSFVNYVFKIFTLNISKVFPGVESRIRATEYNGDRTDFKYY